MTPPTKQTTNSVARGDDGDETLGRHERYAIAFRRNIRTFLSNMRAQVLAINDRVATAAREMTAKWERMDRPVPLPGDSAGMARWLDAEEARVDEQWRCAALALGREPCSDSSSGKAESSTKEVALSAPLTLMNSRETADDLTSEGSTTTKRLDQLVSAEVRRTSSDAPAFLTSLRPKNVGGKRCRSCGVPTSLIPSHWSESYHGLLDELAGGLRLRAQWLRRAVVEVRAAVTARPGGGLVYRVLRVVDGAYDSQALRNVRAYVAAELGVSETGIRRYGRVAYLSVMRKRGAVARVIGYLEAEPVAVAHALLADGQVSATERRVVKFGVSRLWVALPHRRCRVATTMLDAFRGDHALCRSDLAFAPHQAQFGGGHAFVRSYARSNDRDYPPAVYTTSTAWYR